MKLRFDTSDCSNREFYNPTTGVSATRRSKASPVHGEHSFASTREARLRAVQQNSPSFACKPKLKGLDPIVATIVLIVIAVSVAMIITNWQTWFLPSYAENLGSQSQTQLQCIRAGVALDAISYNCSANCFPGVTHTLKATIRNTGDISLPVYSVYLQSRTGDVFEFRINKTLELDETFDFTNATTSSCAAINNSISRITLVTPCTGVSSFDGNAMTWISC